ncbi:MAG: phage terminase large subunit [Alphaproteobacteria bacterium]|nr:phage terminase large subunit [Alphaproteobacteria bacterium]
MHIHSYQAPESLILLKKHNHLSQNRRFNWAELARPNQLPPPGEWQNWLILAGRGFGKTRTGAETIRAWINQGLYKRVALIGQTIDEVRSVMIEGESGLLNVHTDYERPKFESAKGRLIWKNNAIATMYGADHYEKLRGPQFDLAWIDELAKFRHPQKTWDQLMLGLRLGDNPRTIITTTPRPIPLIETLVKDPATVLTKGSTFDNQENLAKTFVKQIVKQFEGTRLGAQELYAEILTEKQGALWKRSIIHHHDPVNPSWLRVVIAIDPAITHHEQSDETGIIVAALSKDQKAYVLEDLSGKYSPAEWGRRVVKAYHKHKADRVVAEVNQGGDMVKSIIHSLDPTTSYKAVRASRGKITRAEPIAALYEQGRVYHSKPFTDLETQLCEYIPGITAKSPDRMDALVWALTDLLLAKKGGEVINLWE